MHSMQRKEMTVPADGDLLLGVDIGTSSSKGVLVRPDGEIVATATRPHGTSLPRPGWAEHDAESVWWADFVAIVNTPPPDRPYSAEYEFV